MARGFYVNFKVPELDQALKNMSKYNGKTALKVEGVVQSSTKAIKNGATMRIHSVSGNLKKRTTYSFNKQKITGTIRSRSPVAHLVEFGAKATVVKPSKKKALTIDQFGNRNYAKEAHIPKRAERPYMRPAYEDEKPNMIRGLREAVQP